MTEIYPILALAKDGVLTLDGIDYTVYAVFYSSLKVRDAGGRRFAILALPNHSGGMPFELVDGAGRTHGWFLATSTSIVDLTGPPRSEGLRS